MPIGTRDYQAMQVSWDKRLSQGVHMSVAYTGSRNVERTAPLNQGEPLYEEVTDTHRPHVLRLTGGWQLPAFEGRGTLARILLGGWQINASTFFRSGLTVADAGQRRPDRRSGPRQPDDGALVQHLHADRRRRAPELRQRLGAAGVPDPRRRTRSTRPARGSRASTAASR